MLLRRSYRVPAWGWRSPFEEFNRLRQQMDRLVDGMGRTSGQRRAAGVYPLVNVTEDGNNFYVRAELPGLSADAIEISVTGNDLAVSGERRIVSEGEDVKYHRREREAGSFSRIISLPGDIEAGGVEASLVNGLLTVVVPKAEAVKPRRIAVK
jgi:HSP20 family protein